MSARVLTTAERFRRVQRDLEAYRRRSLWRRSHARFRRDLHVIPHLFLARDLVRAADLLRDPDDVIETLRGQAVWTLDTASRLACGIGFLTARDLTGYLTPATFEWAAAEGLVRPAQPPSISVTPVFSRPPMLIAHLLEEFPPSVVLASGDRVVSWRKLIADLKGTIGWRPDVLNRIEEPYLRAVGAPAASTP